MNAFYFYCGLYSYMFMMLVVVGYSGNKMIVSGVRRKLKLPINEIREASPINTVITVFAIACILTLGQYCFLSHLLDLPQYLSGRYSVFEGEVQSVSMQNDIHVYSEKEHREKLFYGIYDTDVEKGDEVTLHQLDHAWVGVVIKNNGESVVYNDTRFRGPAFVLIVGVLITLILFNRRYHHRDSVFYVYQALIQKIRVYVYVGWMLLSVIIIVSTYLFFSRWIYYMWIALLICFYLLYLTLCFLDQRRLEFIDNQFYYCTFNTKSVGECKDIYQVRRENRFCEVIMIDNRKLMISCENEEMAEYYTNCIQKLI